MRLIDKGNAEFGSNKQKINNKKLKVSSSDFTTVNKNFKEKFYSKMKEHKDQLKSSFIHYNNLSESKDNSLVLPELYPSPKNACELEGKQFSKGKYGYENHNIKIMPMRGKIGKQSLVNSQGKIAVSPALHRPAGFK